ncbi:MAG: sulfurtransferase [Burkholderiaceae bacterium]
MLLNLSAYRFVDLDRLPERKRRIAADGCSRGLKGTVLLAPEGINLFVSGPESPVREWFDALRQDPAFAGLDAKESWSDAVAFDRWKVRIKREIITLRQPRIRPQDGRAAGVSPDRLERWLAQGHDDDGRPVALVDTRNGFEVQAGSFDGAIDLRLRSFTDFPAAVEAIRPALSGRRIVTFCTGGIRCEKAAIWMNEAGFEHVVQLEGGVLRYFEDTGARHWRGDLFVFDKRVGVDSALAPTVRAVSDAIDPEVFAKPPNGR